MTTTQEASLAELVSQLSQQTSQLVRDELRLAQAEMTAKGKKAGIGAGLFGGAGILGAYGLGALVTAAIAGLAVPLNAWAAALIVAAVLFAMAGVAAMIGKKEVTAAVPPVPEEAIESVKLDLDAVKR